VRLLAPSGAWDDARLQAGIDVLESWGLETVGPNSTGNLRYFSASDAERASEFEAAFADSHSRAVLTVRGGSGAARAMSHIDLSVVASNPKIFCGYSDVSLLLDRIHAEAGLVSFHGPMVGVDLPRISDVARERFRRFLFGEDDWFNGEAEQCWRSGTGVGPLKGGCLAVLVTSLGTPYEIDTSDSVLFIEDVAEAPYAVDRMLVHMKHAGKFDSVSGLAFGPMQSCDGGEGSELLREIVMDVLGDTNFPILFGLQAGHGADNGVLPIGCAVEVDGDACCLRLREAVFA
jgi:muramoyltetrapeptide carboxypeptidase